MISTGVVARKVVSSLQLLKEYDLPKTASTPPVAQFEGEHPGDASLIQAVRDGDVASFGLLYGRHLEAALRLARELVSPADVDDLATEGFSKVLGALQNGSGPTESFRAYLLNSIHNVHLERMRAARSLVVADDRHGLDGREEFAGPAAVGVEGAAAADAFRSLPERWQAVLWHLDVEGEKPADIAEFLAMTPNSVAALAYRAREGLRQAYLHGHLAASEDEDCRWTTSKVAAYVRHGLASRDTQKVDAHLDTCARCTGLYLELREVNSDLGAVLAPALLGAAAVGYVASGAAVTTAGGGARGALRLLGAGIGKVAIQPIRSVPGPAGGAAAAVVVVAVAAATVAHSSGGGSGLPPAHSPAVRAPAAAAPAPSTQTPTKKKTTHKAATETTASDAPPSQQPTGASPSPLLAAPTSAAPTSAAPAPSPSPTSDCTKTNILLAGVDLLERLSGATIIDGPTCY